MKHIFIINPIAGKGKYQHELKDNINNHFKNANLEYEIYTTKYKGDAKRFVLDKCEDMLPYIFYSCGGDGTLHEVINAACNNKHVSVGIIPCGSGNDFVKNFTNIDNFISIKSQTEGEAVLVDLIKAKDEYSISVCNIGFDADAAFNMHKFKKIPFIKGSTCYILSVLYCLLKPLGKKLHVTLDNSKEINETFLLAVIANGGFYGGGYNCAPKAEINDGIIDICFVKKISRLKILSLLKSYKQGTHLEDESLKNYITYEKCKNVKIKSDNSINLCIDGDSYIYDEIDFNIINNALNIWLPKGSVIEKSRLKATI